MESFPDLEGKTSEIVNISFHTALYPTLMVMDIPQGVFAREYSCFDSIVEPVSTGYGSAVSVRVY